MNVRTCLIGLVLTVSLVGQLVAQGSNSRANGPARRTATIAGRVIHPDGAAAESARVAVYAVREGAAAAIVGTATSSYDGRYEVTGIPAGVYMVGVTARKTGGFGGDLKRAPAVPLETFFPGVSERDRAQPITVFEGVPVEGIDVWLAPAPQRFSISGRIFWQGDIEVKNLVIEYGGPNAVRRGVWHVHDPGGLFAIDGVAQETYVLLARGETDRGPLLGIASTGVGFGAVEDVRIMLRTPGAIEGRVTVEGDGGPSPAALRLTAVQTLVTLSPLYPVEEATVSEEGRFELRELAGEYTINVHGLPAEWRLRRVARNGTALANDRIVVSPGERITGVEIVVGPGST